MFNIDKKNTILGAIEKTTGTVYDKDENENLLKYFKPVEMIYIIGFIEETTGKNLSDMFKSTPELMTLRGLETLI